MIASRPNLISTGLTGFSFEKKQKSFISFQLGLLQLMYFSFTWSYPSNEITFLSQKKKEKQFIKF